MLTDDPHRREATVMVDDVITQGPIRRLAATLDRAVPTDVPTLWHWLFCLPSDATSSLADDGHPRHARISDKVEGRRRMYAGGSIVAHDGLRVGDHVTKSSSFERVVDKTGRSGPLAFVTVRHEWSTDRGPAVIEQQDLVYTDSRPVTPDESIEARMPDALWIETIRPDERVLFRFSALTFNTHRIHYDTPHTVADGYTGLLVHGPLLALMLAGLGESHLGAPARSFRFRAVSPAVAGTDIVLTGNPRNGGAELAAWTAGGRKVMDADYAAS